MLVKLFPQASLHHWAGTKIIQQSAVSSDASLSWISSAKGLQALQLQNANAWPEAAHGEQNLSAFGNRQLLQ